MKTVHKAKQPIKTVQIFFLETSKDDLVKIVRSCKKSEVQGQLVDGRSDSTKILMADIEAGTLSRIRQYGIRTEAGQKTIEGVKASRFALGQIRVYSEDLQTVNVPFVRIANHPDFRNGIHFSYFNQDAVHARGGRTSDEKYGYTRYEFLDGKAKTYAPIAHSFITYAEGPAMVSQLGNEKDIPLVLYISERDKKRKRLHVDTESLDIMLYRAIETLIELGSFRQENGGYRTAIKQAEELLERRMKLISPGDRLMNARRRNTYIQMGRCEEVLGEFKNALLHYELSLKYAPLPKNPTKFEEADLAFATSAIERLNKMPNKR